MDNIIPVSSHLPKNDIVYFLDCNILLYLFYPFGNYDRQVVSEYSHLYSQIITKNKIIYNHNLISEFINRYLRMEYEVYMTDKNKNRETFDYKKDYRTTVEYKSSLNVVLDIIRYNFCEFDYVCSNNEFDINRLSNYYNDLNYFDYNDAVYVDLCQEHNAVIVTHDSDFTHISSNVPILTANANML